MLVSDSLNLENTWEMEIPAYTATYIPLRSTSSKMECATFVYTHMHMHTHANTPPILMFN